MLHVGELGVDRLPEPRTGERLEALDAAIPELLPEQEASVLGYLSRRALRAEALYEPVVRPFANRRFSPID